MKKAELVDAVAEAVAEEGLSKAQVERTLNAVLEQIKIGVRDTGDVALIGFGTFELKHRKERQGLNPQTKEKITIPASNTCGFKPGKPFKDFLA